MNEIGAVGGRGRLGDQFQIFDELNYRESELRAVDDAGKSDPFPLPPSGVCQQVGVLRKQNSSKVSSPIEERGIIQSRRTIFLCGENGYTEPAQATCHRTLHMYIHVKRDAHLEPSRFAKVSRESCPEACERRRRCSSN